MGKPSYEALKAQAAKLLAQAEQVRKTEIAAVTRDIVARLEAYGITPADLQAAGWPGAGRRGRKPAAEADAAPARGRKGGRAAKDGKAAKATRGPVAPKYRDPADPANQWTGRGLPPRWLRAYLDAGRAKDEFLIK